MSSEEKPTLRQELEGVASWARQMAEDCRRSAAALDAVADGIMIVIERHEGESDDAGG
ncbi:MAG: hypothetical protein V2J24_23700 [Pseudomonadales bacterium]|nr:hypothetical protein [Pseudomonadales bacterium]